jgi:hypothetical protein
VTWGPFTKATNPLNPQPSLKGARRAFGVPRRPSMTKRKCTPPKPTKPLAKAYIVFGADEYARPRAARFWARHVEPLEEAAAAMNVRLVQVSNPKLAELMIALPPGRLHASGREFLPHVNGETYAELAAATLIQQPSDHPAATTETLPRNWDEVAQGHLVLARETRECGWWEAVVIERKRDLLTLRYRDYPDHPNFVRRRSAVALIAAPAF